MAVWDCDASRKLKVKTWLLCGLSHRFSRCLCHLKGDRPQTAKKVHGCIGPRLPLHPPVHSLTDELMESDDNHNNWRKWWCGTDSRDPCATVRCYFGAQCVASADSLTGTCECPSANNDTRCSPDEPVCGDDNRDYRNVCQLRTASCHNQRLINIKFHGKCGIYLLTYCRSFSLVW